MTTAQSDRWKVWRWEGSIWGHRLPLRSTKARHVRPRAHSRASQGWHGGHRERWRSGMQAGVRLQGPSRPRAGLVPGHYPTLQCDHQDRRLARRLPPFRASKGASAALRCTGKGRPGAGAPGRSAGRQSRPRRKLRSAPICVRARPASGSSRLPMGWGSGPFSGSKRR